MNKDYENWFTGWPARIIYAGIIIILVLASMSSCYTSKTVKRMTKAQVEAAKNPYIWKSKPYTYQHYFFRDHQSMKQK
jgi:hypothetical protein